MAQAQDRYVSEPTSPGETDRPFAAAGLGGQRFVTRLTQMCDRLDTHS